MLKSTFLATVGLLTIFSMNKSAKAFTFNVDNVSVVWETLSGTANGSSVVIPSDSDSIFWGEPPTDPVILDLLPEDQRPNLAPDAPLEEKKSGLSFVGGTGQDIQIGEPFLLGTLSHFNNQLRGGTGLDSVIMNIELSFTINPDLPTAESYTQSFAFLAGIEETANTVDNPFFEYDKNGQPIAINFLKTRSNALFPSWQAGVNCKYVGRVACPDRVFPAAFLSDEIVEIGGVDYTLGLVGFSEDSTGSDFVGGITGEGRSQQATFYVFTRLFEDPKTDPPQASIGSPLIVNEGESFEIVAQSDVENPSYAWDLNEDLIYNDHHSSKIEHYFPNDRESPYLIRLRVGDGDNGTLIEPPSSKITVRNVAPEITFLTEDLSILEGEPISFAATAFDPGIEDILTFDWDLDDDGEFNDFVGSSGEHTFSGFGAFPVGLRVSDNDGGTAFGTFDVQVAKVPESSNRIGLMLLGLVGLGSFAEQRYKRLTRNEK